MKVSPIPSTIAFSDPIGQAPSRIEALKLKMTTNANPTMLQAPMPPLEAINNTSETNAPVEATQPLSPQLALLARQRRALQVKERELRNREKALQAQPSQGSTLDVGRLKSEPLAVLLENGVTYDQLAEAITSGKDNSELYALRAKIEALEKGIDQKFVDKDAETKKQVLTEMEREASLLVKSVDDYELVRETNSVPSIIRLIERTYNETGEVLDIGEACKLVEDELFKDAQRLAKTKKMLGQLSPMPLQQQPQQREIGMRTLTNRDTASVPMSAKQRAIAAFYGQLKR